MPLPLPNLDDRDYQALYDDALKIIRTDLDTDWNDLAPGDPGVVLLEAFTYLTEQMLYRLNRLPDKVYTAFLRLLGVTQAPPTAARVMLEFSRDQGTGPAEIILPRGTRVGANDGSEQIDQPVFLTGQEVKLPAVGKDNAATAQGMVMAYQCEQVEEDLGASNHLPGQVFQIQRPPIAAPLGNWLDLLVGVESSPAERQSTDKKGSDGLYYRLWREVDDFSETDISSEVFTVDRLAGTIQFAPAARRYPEQPPQNGNAWLENYYKYLGAVPKDQRRIRAWYSRCVGEAGNLPAGKLARVLDDGLTGVKVTNPKRAWGGRDGETLENALVRGPYEAFARQNVVTKRDYEEVVKQPGRAIARAYAYSLEDRWKYAKPGTVEVALVPDLPSDQRKQVTLENLQAAESEHTVDFDAIQRDLAAKTPVGTHSKLAWARYKEVSVVADLVLDDNVNDQQAIYDSLAQRLYDLISPLDSVQQPNGSFGSAGSAGSGPAAPKSNGSGPAAAKSTPGWPFGQELRVAQVYQTLLSAEPRIKLIDRLALRLEKAPEKEEIHCLAADFFQPHTWYAGSGSSVFRSTNDGTGWEAMLTLDPTAEPGGPANLYFPHPENGQKPEPRYEQPAVIRPNPDRPGLVALATTLDGKTPGKCSALYLSADCGETWYCHTRDFSYEITDMAWLLRASQPILLLATTWGLYELDIALTGAGQPDLGTENPLTFDAPLPVPVDADVQKLPLNAVVVLRYRGSSRVAVAAKSRLGVYLSLSDDLIPTNGNINPLAQPKPAAGLPASKGQANGNRNCPPEELKTNFDLLGLKGEDIRCLGAQTYYNDLFLWAGDMAVGDQAKGCYRWHFDQLVLEEPQAVLQARQAAFQEPPAALQPELGTWINERWTGGSCHALAFLGRRVFAATAWGGVLEADFDPDHQDESLVWRQLETGHLPKRLSNLDENGKLSVNKQIYFEPLLALETGPESALESGPTGEATGPLVAPAPLVIMAAGANGIFRRMEAAGFGSGAASGANGVSGGGNAFERISRAEFQLMKDAVTIPFNWLLVSGTHQIGAPGQNQQIPPAAAPAAERPQATLEGNP